MEGESGVTGSIIDRLYSLEIQGNQMEGKSGLTRNIIDEVHVSDIQQLKLKVKNVLFEVSLLNLILL